MAMDEFVSLAETLPNTATQIPPPPFFSEKRRRVAEWMVWMEDDDDTPCYC